MRKSRNDPHKCCGRSTVLCIKREANAEATATEFLFHLGEESKLVSKGVEVD